MTATTEPAQGGPPRANGRTETSLLEARVILEACPPAVADRNKAYAVLQQCFLSYNTFHAISIPDIQDEGEFSRRRSRIPNAEFAAWLRQLTGKPWLIRGTPYLIHLADRRPPPQSPAVKPLPAGIRGRFLIWRHNLPGSASPPQHAPVPFCLNLPRATGCPRESP
jgi:hypothetical protein